MKIISIFLSLFAFLLFQGCSIINQNTKTINKASNPTYVSQQTQKKSKFLHVKQKSVKQSYPNQIKLNSSIYSGSIKGIIENLRYIKRDRTWEYEIRGLDTSNFKLPYAKFQYRKKLAKQGDYVYVILKNSNLVNLFLIKKANIITKKRKRVKKIVKPKVKVSVKHKRDESRKNKNISVPQEVQISFD